MKMLLVMVASAMLLASLVNMGAAAPVHWASGGGTVLYEGTLNTHAFTAQIDADGNVKGQAQFQLRYIDTTVHARVNCLEVVGNDAWIGGTITRSSNPAQVGLGLPILFRVHDSGEGDGQPPDMTTQLVWGAVPSCNSTPPLSLIAWTNGNVQVRSASKGPISVPVIRATRSPDSGTVEEGPAADESSAPVAQHGSWGRLKVIYR